MLHPLISRSPDLQRLQNEGYELDIRSGFLLVNSVPYVNSRKEVRRGTLVAKLALAGDRRHGRTITSRTSRESIPAMRMAGKSRR